MDDSGLSHGREASVHRAQALSRFLGHEEIIFYISCPVMFTKNLNYKSCTLADDFHTTPAILYTSVKPCAAQNLDLFHFSLLKMIGF